MIFKISLDPKSIPQKAKQKILLHGPDAEGQYFATSASLDAARVLAIPFQIRKDYQPSQIKIPIIHSFPAVLMSQPNEPAREEALAYAMGRAGESSQVWIVYEGRDIPIGADNQDCFYLDMAGGRRHYTWKLVFDPSKLPQASVEKSFQKILNRIKDPDTKVVLSFSGGGLKVLAHTALMGFLNTLGVYDEIDEMWGTSGGAIAALWYASGVSPDAMNEYGFGLYNRSFSLKLSPSKLEVLRNLFINYCIPAKFRSNSFAGFIDSATSLTDFIMNLKQDAEIKKPFYCIAFNLHTLRAEVLTSEAIGPEVYPQKRIWRVEPIEAVVASCSVPIVFIPKIIKRDGLDIQYIDGCVEENIPMKSVYEKWIADKKMGREKRQKLLLICSTTQSGRFSNLMEPRFLREHDMFQITLNILFQAIAQNQREFVERDPNVEIWDFSIPLEHDPQFDFKLIPSFIQAGYRSVASQAHALESKKPAANV